MNPAANEIEARVEANAKTWLLPTRDSSSIRSFAWAALGSGIIGCLFMLVWASGLLSWLFFSDSRIQLFYYFQSACSWQPETI